MDDELVARIRRIAPNADVARLHALPHFLDLWSAAELISRLFFPISPCTLPTWPVGWKQINGRRHCPTSNLLAEAARRIESPPSKRGAHLRRPKAATTAAVVAAVAE